MNRSFSGSSAFDLTQFVGEDVKPQSFLRLFALIHLQVFLAQVAELLVKHGAVVNVADLWKFTPLHEAAAKGKYDICKLLLKHGADPLRKNRDGNTPLDLVKEGDTDIQVSILSFR